MPLSETSARSFRGWRITNTRDAPGAMAPPWGNGMLCRTAVASWRSESWYSERARARTSIVSTRARSSRVASEPFVTRTLTCRGLERLFHADSETSVIETAGAVTWACAGGDHRQRRMVSGRTRARADRTDEGRMAFVA